MSTTHRMLRRTLEVCVPSRALGEKWRREARALWEESLLPALEEVLNDACGPEETLRIPRVTVELRVGPVLDSRELAESFAAQVRDQLAGNTVSRPDAGKPERVPPPVHRRQWLAWFLEKGSLPWWAPVRQREEIEQALVEEVSSGAEGQAWFAGCIRGNEAVAARIALGFPVVLQREIMGRIDPGMAARWSEWEIWMETVFSREHGPVVSAVRILLLEGFWRAWARRLILLPPCAEAERHARDVLAEVTIRPSGFEAWRRLMSPVVARWLTSPDVAPATPSPRVGRHSVAATGRPGRLTPGKVPAVKPAESPARIAPDAGAQPLPVPNAGLVLLAPFLPRYFSTLGIRLSRREEERADAELGPLLLHQTATGEARAAESDLVIPKLLCGLPPDMAVPCDWPITDTQREEGERLLRAVIAHWTALRSTTPAGLRQAFLQRHGLLREELEQWELRVENHGWDVLLDRVPWTFRTVLLPWMNKPLLVDWQAYA